MFGYAGLRRTIASLILSIGALVANPVWPTEVQVFLAINTAPLERMLVVFDGSDGRELNRKVFTGGLGGLVAPQDSPLVYFVHQQNPDQVELVSFDPVAWEETDRLALPERGEKLITTRDGEYLGMKMWRGFALIEPKERRVRVLWPTAGTEDASFSPDGSSVLLSGWGASTHAGMTIWNLETGELEQSFPGFYRLSAFSVDGRHVGGKADPLPSNDPGYFRVFDRMDGSLVAEIAVPHPLWDASILHLDTTEGEVCIAHNKQIDCVRWLEDPGTRTISISSPSDLNFGGRIGPAQRLESILYTVQNGRCIPALWCGWHVPRDRRQVHLTATLWPSGERVAQWPLPSGWALDFNGGDFVRVVAGKPEPIPVPGPGPLSLVVLVGLILGLAWYRRRNLETDLQGRV